MFDDTHKDLMPELKDILNRIKAFNISHKEGQFLFSFLGFKKDSENICDDCGEYCDDISDSKTVFGAYGHLDLLREMINHMRDTVEDNIDENGFVSF